MKIVIDMNLSPLWVEALEKQGWTAVHWSTIGDPRAPDQQIMQWALDHEHIVFTHDLDFGAILASTQASAPGVIQVRAQNVLPDHLEPIVVTAILQCREQLEAGALVVVDEKRHRVRILPIERK
jgi:predicted nuclease of predicted toxin-antitoxin system